jgi:hypothetical protein
MLLLKVVGVLLIGVSLATLAFAFQWQDTPALGAPFGYFGAWPLYSPWDGLRWCWWWCGSHPSLFLGAGLTFGGTMLLLGGIAIWGAVITRRQATDGLATPRQLRKAKVLRKEGIIVGRQP